MYLHWPSTNATRPAIFDSSFWNVVCQKIATSQVIHKFHIFTHLVYNVSGTDSNLPELYTQVPQSDANMLSAVTWHLRCFTLLRIHSLVLLLIRDFKQLASATLDGKVILRAVIHASFVNFEVANQWSKTRLQWRDLATRNDMIHHSRFTEMDHETGFFHSVVAFLPRRQKRCKVKINLATMQ